MSLHAIKHDCPTCTCTEPITDPSFTKKEIAFDADNFGNALNDASWEFVDAYREHIGDIPTSLFNDCKALVRKSILKYIEKVNQ